MQVYTIENLAKTTKQLLWAILFGAAMTCFAAEEGGIECKKMVAPQDRIHYITVQGSEIESYIDDMVRLRLAVFRESPYFYEGTEACEKEYLSQYLNSKNSLFVVAKSGTKVIGIISGLPLRELESSAKIFSKNNVPVDSVYYLGEMVIDAPYRKFGAELSLYQTFEDHVRSLGCYDQIAECVVMDAETDPSDYSFEKMGAVKQPHLVDCFFWEEIGKEGSVPHFMQYWIKGLDQ